MSNAERLSRLQSEIESKRAELISVSSESGVLLRKSNELDNGYRALLYSKKSSAGDGYPRFDERFAEAELAALEARERYLAKKTQEQSLRDEIAALEADIAGSSTEAKVAYQRMVYSEQHAKLDELVSRAQVLEGEFQAAHDALNAVQFALGAAQDEKRKALCVADVASATHAEAAAQSRVDDLLTLIRNIDAEKVKLNAEREQIGKSLALAESALWAEVAKLMLEELHRSPEFEHVATAMKRVYIAHGKGGLGFNVDAFLTHTFSGWKKECWPLAQNASVGEELATEFGIQGKGRMTEPNAQALSLVDVPRGEV